MFPALNIGRAICSFTVPDGHIHNFKIQLCGSKYQIVISKWIEIPKILAVIGDLLIIPSPKNFCPAKGIFNWLTDEKGKDQA